MGKFALGKGFDDNGNGVKRYNMRDLDTPYGPMFAYQVEFANKHITVCFPLICNLPPEDGFHVKEIGDFVPPEQRETVSEILTREGYKGEIKW
jgi:hypothetical protein